MLGVLYEIGLADFVIVTLVLGGAAAYMTGRAVARSWEPGTRAIAWVVPLAAATRFIHFALFHGTLLTLHFYLVDFVILTLFAMLGHRVTRFRQMTRGYAWTIEPAQMLSWKLRR